MNIRMRWIGFAQAFLLLASLSRADVIGQQVETMVKPGASASIGLRLVSSGAVYAINGDLQFDPAKLQDVSIGLGSGAANHLLLAGAGAAGTLRFDLFDPSTARTFDLSKPVLLVSFTVKQSVSPAGQTAISFANCAAARPSAAPQLFLSIGRGGPGGNPSAETVRFDPFLIRFTNASAESWRRYR
ncbi:MAG: hypothetical protein BWZ10_01805 [candidate division BRC1 bacterium ADurb.BinA364]|nr:MAG: hypothetical protein BWZ10_01805 [candidate division BRC1 bacterium ADurb.BinA364]